MKKERKKVGITAKKGNLTHSELVSSLRKMVIQGLAESHFTDQVIADVLNVNRSSIFRTRQALAKQGLL